MQSKISCGPPLFRMVILRLFSQREAMGTSQHVKVMELGILEQPGMIPCWLSGIQGCGSCSGNFPFSVADRTVTHLPLTHRILPFWFHQNGLPTAPTLDRRRPDCPDVSPRGFQKGSVGAAEKWCVDPLKQSQNLFMWSQVENPNIYLKGWQESFEMMVCRGLSWFIKFRIFFQRSKPLGGINIKSILLNTPSGMLHLDIAIS